jgi:hypothetical protein
MAAAVAAASAAASALAGTPLPSLPSLPPMPPPPRPQQHQHEQQQQQQQQQQPPASHEQPQPPPGPQHHFHRERRRDLTPLQLAVFDAMAAGSSSSSSRSSSAGATAGAPPSHRRPPLCKLWAMYRKALRLFLLGELSKPELDAVVIYALGEDKGACIVHAVCVESRRRPPLSLCHSRLQTTSISPHQPTTQCTCTTISSAG